MVVGIDFEGIAPRAPCAGGVSARLARVAEHHAVLRTAPTPTDRGLDVRDRLGRGAAPHEDLGEADGRVVVARVEVQRAAVERLGLRIRELLEIAKETKEDDRKAKERKVSLFDDDIEPLFE